MNVIYHINNVKKNLNRYRKSIQYNSKFIQDKMLRKLLVVKDSL